MLRLLPPLLLTLSLGAAEVPTLSRITLDSGFVTLGRYDAATGRLLVVTPTGEITKQVAQERISAQEPVTAAEAEAWMKRLQDEATARIARAAEEAPRRHAEAMAEAERQRAFAEADAVRQEADAKKQALAAEQALKLVEAEMKVWTAAKEVDARDREVAAKEREADARRIEAAAALTAAQVALRQQASGRWVWARTAGAPDGEWLWVCQGSTRPPPPASGPVTPKARTASGAADW